MRTTLFLVLLCVAGCGAEQRAAAPAEERLIRAGDGQDDIALLAQAAHRAGLEREPAVALAVETARRQALADAWLERVSGALPGITADEVKAFYASNPALFAQRRIYHYEELAVTPPERLLAPLAAEAAVARRLDEVGRWLGEEGVAVAAPRAVVRAAEDVPLAHLRRIASLREGEIALLAAPGAIFVVQLVQSRPAPISEPEALASIERFLVNRRRGELARAEIERLRKGARTQQVSLTSRRQS